MTDRLTLVSNQHSTLNDQVSQIVAENQHLRVKSDGDDKVIALLKEQYEQLSSSVNGMRDQYERQLHAARTERDLAKVAYQEIEALLLQSANIITQGLHARVVERPEPQDRAIPYRDERLPAASLVS